MGHLVMLELARRLPDLKHFVYASSSSVYGGNRKQPFAIGDRVDHPISLYAATKRADELLTETYVHLLQAARRPACAISRSTGRGAGPTCRRTSSPRRSTTGAPINLYHLGFVKRDYSYIDDIVAGTLAVLDKPAEAAGHRLYNLAASRSEDILDVIKLFEKAFGKEARVELKPGEPADMQETSADISDAMRDFDWQPKVTVAEGVPKFVEWFKEYNRL